jgi:hypothetical protein
MATLVPDGSSWYQILKETGERWKQASGGRVTVRLFPGGVAGDDPDVVRKMRLGTLNAGRADLGRRRRDRQSVYAMGIPLMYDSYEEVDWVHEKMRPKLEASLEAKGFVALNWVDGGWVRFFAKKPVAGAGRPARAQALLVGGRRQSVEVWRSAGFNPVPLPSTELSTALQTGLVEALGSPPQVAVISQFFNHATNMTALRWQLLQGATLVAKSSLGQGARGRAAAAAADRARGGRQAPEGDSGRRAARHRGDAEARADGRARERRAARAVAEAHRQPLSQGPGEPRAGRGVRRGDALARRVPQDPSAGGEVSEAPGASADGSLSAPPASRLARILRGLEHALLIGALLAAALLPLADTLGRPFGCTSRRAPTT